MLSAEQCIAKARTLSARAAVERMPPSEFLAFAEWLGLSDTVDGQEDGAERGNAPLPQREDCRLA